MLIYHNSTIPSKKRCRKMLIYYDSTNPSKINDTEKC